MHNCRSKWGHYSTFLEEDLQKNTVNLLWASKITHVRSRKNIGVKICQKATLQKISGKNPLFFLKSIHQIAPLFKERVLTRMPTGYTFNAPGEKYRQLGELCLNLCGGILASTAKITK